MLFPTKVALGALLAALVAGCGSAEEPQVRAAADAYASAAGRGDGARVCSMLTARARSDVESFGRSCAATAAQLPAPGTVRTVEVWGDSAQVRFDADVVFLALFEDHWLVRAAGCRPRDGGPYDCAVHG
ncbi:hypothetical protein ACQEVB_35300 [Pseudonocardia sp. CA-107938]|uniref:hypothetical protein n=1 Tax=Pseudonocardia sp. CA-107938 TaxID=3240021 RepID=UPI003D925380